MTTSVDDAGSVPLRFGRAGRFDPSVVASGGVDGVVGHMVEATIGGVIGSAAIPSWLDQATLAPGPAT